MRFGSREGRLPSNDLPSLVEALASERAETLQSRLFDALNAGKAAERELIAALSDREARFTAQISSLRAESEHAREVDRQLARQELEAQATEARLQEEELIERLAVAGELKEQLASQMEALRAAAQQELAAQTKEFDQREESLQSRIRELAEQIDTSRRAADDQTAALRVEINKLHLQVEALLREAVKELEAFASQIISLRAESDRVREQDRQLAQQQLQAQAEEARARHAQLIRQYDSLLETTRRAHDFERRSIQQQLDAQAQQLDARTRQLEAQMQELDALAQQLDAQTADSLRREREWREQLDSARRRIDEKDQAFLAALQQREEQFTGQLGSLRGDAERARNTERELIEQHWKSRLGEFRRKEELGSTIGELSVRLSDFEHSWLARLRSIFVPAKSGVYLPAARPAGGGRADDFGDLDVLEPATGSERQTPTSLSDLMTYEDQEFVGLAYRAVLGRAADPSGLAHYVDMLRHGAGKLEIVRILRTSDEGRARRAN